MKIDTMKKIIFLLSVQSLPLLSQNQFGNAPLQMNRVNPVQVFASNVMVQQQASNRQNANRSPVSRNIDASVELNINDMMENKSGNAFGNEQLQIKTAAPNPAPQIN